MANQLVLTDCSVIFGAPIGDVSAKTKSCTINFTPDMIEDTHMGHTGKSRAKGLADWSIDLEVYQDFTDEALDEDIWTIVNAGTPLTIIISPAPGAPSDANPHYGGTCVIDGYSPISGAVGELQIVKLKCIAAGTTLERTVA